MQRLTEDQSRLAADYFRSVVKWHGFWSGRLAGGRNNRLSEELFDRGIDRLILASARHREGPASAGFFSFVSLHLRHARSDAIRRFCGDPFPAIGCPSAPDSRPEHEDGDPAMLRRYDLEDFEEAIRGLTGPERETLALLYAEGLSHEDAAGRLGLSPGEVYRRVRLAFSRLAYRLGREAEVVPRRKPRAARPAPKPSETATTR